MIAMPNSHLVLHKETLKQHFENKISIKHFIKIINLGAKNCPVGRNGLSWRDFDGPGVDERLGVVVVVGEGAVTHPEVVGSVVDFSKFSLNLV